MLTMSMYCWGRKAPSTGITGRWEAYLEPLVASTTGELAWKWSQHRGQQRRSFVESTPWQRAPSFFGHWLCHIGQQIPKFSQVTVNWLFGNARIQSILSTSSYLLNLSPQYFFVYFHSFFTEFYILFRNCASFKTGLLSIVGHTAIWCNQ